MKARRQPFYREATTWLIGLALLTWFISGCATPIGVTRGTTQDTYATITASVLSTGAPSIWSKQVLHRSHLTESYDDDPRAALAAIRKTFADRVTPDRLFALSELSFHTAEQSGSNEDYLAAVVYAYAFLFPEDRAPPPDPLDPISPRDHRGSAPHPARTCGRMIGLKAGSSSAATKAAICICACAAFGSRPLAVAVPLDISGLSKKLASFESRATQE